MSRKLGAINISVGKRLRARRIELGLSQRAVATALGVKFQQVQKYEVGRNSLSVDRLFLLSQVLEVPVSHFFDDLKNDDVQCGRRLKDALASNREKIEMMKAFIIVPDHNVRRKLCDLMRCLSPTDAE